MNEPDIPRSDCGTDLVDRTVRVRDLPVSTGWNGEVAVETCPTCDARDSPDHTLTRSVGAPSPTRTLGDV